MAGLSVLLTGAELAVLDGLLAQRIQEADRTGAPTEQLRKLRDKMTGATSELDETRLIHDANCRIYCFGGECDCLPERVSPSPSPTDKSP